MGRGFPKDALATAAALSGVTAEADCEEASSSDVQANHPSPRGLARSLSKQIDNVDIGLDNIKDMLVAQSPDMDPSDILSLFMPDGPITTDPRTPIVFDDFLDADTGPFAWPSLNASASIRGLPAPPKKACNLDTPNVLSPHS